MEKDTVLLDLKKYNELRECKEGVEAGKFLVTWRTYNSWDGSFADQVRYYTDSQVHESLIAKIKALEIANDLLKNPKQDVTLSDVKRMNWREFRKWKRSNK